MAYTARELQLELAENRTIPDDWHLEVQLGELTLELDDIEWDQAEERVVLKVSVPE